MHIFGCYVEAICPWTSPKQYLPWSAEERNFQLPVTYEALLDNLLLLDICRRWFHLRDDARRQFYELPLCPSTWLVDCLDPTAPSSEIKTLKSVRYALQKDTA